MGFSTKTCAMYMCHYSFFIVKIQDKLEFFCGLVGVSDNGGLVKAYFLL